MRYVSGSPPGDDARAATSTRPRPSCRVVPTASQDVPSCTCSWTGRPTRTGFMVAVIAALAASALTTPAPYCTIGGSASSRTRWREVTRNETFVGSSSTDAEAEVEAAEAEEAADGPDHGTSPRGRRSARVVATRRWGMPLGRGPEAFCCRALLDQDPG